MKLLIALALAAAPSALAMAPYVPSTDEPTPAPTPMPPGDAQDPIHPPTYRWEPDGAVDLLRPTASPHTPSPADLCR